MSGEIPTEASSLDRVTQAVAFARNILLHEVAFPVSPIEVDLSLGEVFSAIKTYYDVVGNPAVLTDALEAEDDRVRKQTEMRAAFLEKYGFGSDTEAAEHIASYWQGEQPDNLLDSIRGYGDIEISNRANQLASDATKDNSEAQQNFRGAQALLWRSYRGGHG